MKKSLIFQKKLPEEGVPFLVTQNLKVGSFKGGKPLKKTKRKDPV